MSPWVCLNVCVWFQAHDSEGKAAEAGIKWRQERAGRGGGLQTVGRMLGLTWALKLGSGFLINLSVRSIEDAIFFLYPPPPQLSCFSHPAFLLHLHFSILWYPLLLPHFSIPPSVLYLPSYPQALCISCPATAMYDALLLKLFPLVTELWNSQCIQPLWQLGLVWAALEAGRGSSL